MKKIKACVSILMLVLVLFGCVPFSDTGLRVAYAAPSFATMDDQEFVRYLMKNTFAAYPFWEADFSARYTAHMNGKYTATYPWATTTDEEFGYLAKGGKIDYASCDTNPDFRVLYERYNATEKQEDIKQAWADSKLVGDENSHGISFVKEPTIYSRPDPSNRYGVVSGKDLSVKDVTSEEPDGIGKLIMEFLCWLVYWLAEQLDGLLTNGGIALDNVIFGRVAGYGVKFDGVSDYITLFGFELENDNPYGYVAAILFQRIRSFIYIFMALFCLYKLIRIACKGDYDGMKLDAKTFAGNVVLSFGAIVMMPYILDLFLYVRDVILKGITYATLDDMFGATGFLSAFRSVAGLESTDLIANIIYLGAVVLSLFVAGIYIAYAMSMMVHFIFFPAVCLRGLSDNRAYGEWAKEALSLTIMPIVDGMILLIPLTFTKMANGNLALNLLSLIACGLLMVVRKQVKRTLSLQDNSGLDNGAIATVLGLGMAARGLGNAAKKAAGKLGGGVKQASELMQAAKEDSQMAEIQDMESQIPESGGVSAPVYGSVGADTPDGSPGYSRADIAAAKAEMYRKRASQKHWKAAAKVTGGVFGAAGAVGGGAVGATVGAGAGAFMGPSMQMAAMGGGASAGATVGGAIGDMTGQLGIYGGKLAWAAAAAVETKTRLKGRVDDISVEPVAGVEPEIWDPFAEFREWEEERGTVDFTDLPAVASDGGAVGRSHVVDRESLEIFFRKDEGKNAMDYYSAAVSAVQRMEERPGALMHDDDFGGKINNVKEQISSLVSRARSGEDRESLLHGVGGLDELRQSFGTMKRDRLASDMSINLNVMGAEYSPESMLHRSALNSVVNHMATDVIGGKEPMLKESGRYMTGEYDKAFGIYWDEAAEMIEARGRRI